MWEERLNGMEACAEMCTLDAVTVNLTFDGREIMVNTPSIAALIRDNKTFRINSDIQTGAKYGMVKIGRAHV